MDNVFCVIVTGMLFTITACLLFYIVKNHSGQAFIKRYVWFYSLLLLWNAMEIAYYSVKSESVLRYIYDLRVVVTAGAFAAFLLAAIALYRSERRAPPWLFVIVAAPAAATAAVSVLGFDARLVTTSFNVVSFEPFVQLDARRGVWFYLMALYVAAMVLAAAVLIVLTYSHRPKAYRGESALTALSLLFFALGAAMEGLSPIFNFIGYWLVALGGILLYLALELRGRAGFLQIERADVFDYLDAAVLLLGPGGEVIDMNKSARGLMDIFGEDAEGKDLDGLLLSLFTRGKILRLSRGGQTTDVYVANANYPLIYRMYRQRIPAAGKAAAWSYASFDDVTRNQMLVERLQDMAGVDSLTGLYNRYGYMELMRKLDLPENLPISVIMGDVNGLKQINDAYGHAAGDRFLASIAAAIKSCCDENCFAARIGGDEFVVLAKHCDEEQAAALTGRLHDAVAHAEGLEEKPSIALGSATKRLAHENINALLNRADRQMYSVKK